MSISSLSRNRAAGLGLAALMVSAGCIALAPESIAAAAAVKVSPATGATTGSVLTITGKGFQNEAGTDLVGTVEFDTGACGSAPTGGVADAASVSVISATKVVVTSPTLTAVKHNVCLFTATSPALMGQGQFTAYTPVSSLSMSSTPSGPSFGGTKVVVSGNDFTAKTTATIGGKAIVGAKVTLAAANANPDTLSGTLPAGNGEDKTLTVTNEGGSVNLAAAFDYLDAVKVSPVAGQGADNSVIEVTGVGFRDRDFVGTGEDDSVIALVPGGTNIAPAQTVPTTRLCDTVQVESDTTLNCQLNGAVSDGAYSLVIFTRANTTTNIKTATAISKSATYTVADF